MTNGAIFTLIISAKEDNLQHVETYTLIFGHVLPEISVYLIFLTELLDFRLHGPLSVIQHFPNLLETFRENICSIFPLLEIPSFFSSIS